MKRLARLFPALLALALTGQAPASVPLPKATGPIFSSKDFVPPGTADATPGLQRALDAAQAWAAGNNANFNQRATVRVEGGANYTVTRPLSLDGDLVRFETDDGTRVAMLGGLGYPVLTIGIPRGPGGGTTVPDSRFRSDLFGVLDATAVSGAGRRWSIEFGPDLSLIAPAGCFSHGGLSPTYGPVPDNWAETDKLTIDLAISGPSGGAVQPGTILLLGNDGASGLQGGTFGLYADAANSFVFFDGTQAARFGPATVNAWRFTTGNAAGLQRIAVQVDHAAGTIAAFADGVQVAVTGPKVPAGVKLAENQFAVFAMNQHGSEPAPVGTFSLAGLCESRSVRYTVPGVGQPQARADGKPLTDAYRYFPPSAASTSDQYDPAMIGCLDLDESPDAASRLMTIRGGAAAAWRPCAAFLLNAATINGPYVAYGHRLDRLKLQTDQCYGAAVLLGKTLDLGARDCDLWGGLYGIGSVPIGVTTYPVSIEGGSLSGSDAGYFGCKPIATIRGVQFPSNGRAAIRLLGGRLDVRDCFVTRPSPWQQAFIMRHASDVGWKLHVVDCLCDNEGSTFGVGGIVVEPDAYGRTTFETKRVDFGTLGSVPLVLLRGVGAAPVWPGAAADVADVTGGSTGPAVAVDGVPGAWSGRVGGLLGGNGSVMAAPGAVAGVTSGLTVAVPASPTMPVARGAAPGTGNVASRFGGTSLAVVIAAFIVAFAVLLILIGRKARG